MKLTMRVRIPSLSYPSSAQRGSRWFFGANAFISILLITLTFPPILHADDEIEEKELCPHIVLRGKDIPSLKETEVRLVCGDPKTTDAVGHSWQTIPFTQAKFHLETFLQMRGFYRATYTLKLKETGQRRPKPSVTVAEAQGDRALTAQKMVVELGDKTEVSEVKGEDIPAEIRFQRKRGIQGEILTPTLLDQMEQWTSVRAQAVGYACPVIASSASAQTGEITVTGKLNERQNLVRILDENIGGIAPGILNRYDAFEIGKPFNGDLISLTQRRIVTSGVLQGVNFSYECKPEGVTVTRTGIEGPPRLLSFGVGTNTEGLILLKASWKNTRLGKYASNFDITALGSTKTQQVNAAFTWYHLPYASRRYLRPATSFRRLNEIHYDVSIIEPQFLMGTSYDNQELGLSARVGPTVEFIHNNEDRGPRDTHFLSLRTEARIESHYHEFYRSSPRTGYSLGVQANFNAEPIYSDADAQRVFVDWEGLLNFNEYDPPLFIFGLRGGYALTASDERPGRESRLPPHFFQYLGGSQSVRGFGRLELPQNGEGSMTSVYSGIEIRWAGAPLPLSIQPFVFTDAGALGRDPMRLDPTIYWSPGFGLRSDPGFGTFRATLAHGYVAGERRTRQVVDPETLSHWQFYFSFGEEF